VTLPAHRRPSAARPIAGRALPALAPSIPPRKRRVTREVLVAIALAALAPGCAVFPQGTYWPAAARHAAVSEPPAGCQPPAASRGAEPPPTAAAGAARIAALQEKVARHWSSEDLVRSARRMDGPLGRSAWADAMQTVVWFYVDPVTYRGLVVAGLESLRAALENPSFRERFPEAADAAKRGRFAEALDVLLLKARAADPWFAFQAADWLAVAMEKNRAMLGLPDGAVVGEFLFGAMDSLDAYSRYLTPEMLRVYNEALEGAYAGVGAELAVRGARFFIKTLFDGGAAAKAGLRAGDEIVSVGGQPAGGLGLAEIGRRLRGKPGTKVTVGVRTGGEGAPHDVVLVRGVVHLPAARDAQIVDAARRVGYVRLTEFQNGAEAELRRAVESLARQGAKALILDLRDNPGGSLLEAVWAAGMFLEGGPIVRTRGRMPGATWNYDVPWFDAQAWRGPLAVLVNEGTASAAEVMASALEARGRATTVGRRTFGKGAVQIYFPADWGASAVSVTIARVWDVRGECLNGRGVTPQREVAPAASPPESLRDDPVVCAAVEALAAP
jgi:carboxyl-terminal processing protease